MLKRESDQIDRFDEILRILEEAREEKNGAKRKR